MEERHEKRKTSGLCRNKGGRFFSKICSKKFEDSIALNIEIRLNSRVNSSFWEYRGRNRACSSFDYTCISPLRQTDYSRSASLVFHFINSKLRFRIFSAAKTASSPMPVPKSAPARISDGKCTYRYSLEKETSSAIPNAGIPRRLS